MGCFRRGKFLHRLFCKIHMGNYTSLYLKLNWDNWVWVTQSINSQGIVIPVPVDVGLRRFVYNSGLYGALSVISAIVSTPSKPDLPTCVCTRSGSSSSSSPRSCRRAPTQPGWSWVQFFMWKKFNRIKSLLQGGRSWLAFGERKIIPQSFRRARICKFSRQKRRFFTIA